VLNPRWPFGSAPGKAPVIGDTPEWGLLGILGLLALMMLLPIIKR
jgi:hypothetical protein